MINVNLKENYKDFRKIEVCKVYGFRTNAAVYLVPIDLNGLVVLEDDSIDLLGTDLKDYTIGDIMKRYFDENETIEKIYQTDEDFTIDFTENK